MRSGCGGSSAAPSPPWCGPAGQEHAEPGRGAAEVARHAEEVAGLRAAAVHDGLLVGLPHDRHGQRQPGRGRHVAADDGQPVALARLRDPGVERLGALDRQVAGSPRATVANRGRAFMATTSLTLDAIAFHPSARSGTYVRSKWTPSTIASVVITWSGWAVGAGAADAVDGRVVADAGEEVAGVRGVGQRGLHPVDQAELAHLGDGREGLGVGGLGHAGRGSGGRRTGTPAPCRLRALFSEPLRSARAPVQAEEGGRRRPVLECRRR